MSKIREKESLECGRMHIWALKTQKFPGPLSKPWTPAVECSLHSHESASLCWQLSASEAGPPPSLNPGSAPGQWIPFLFYNIVRETTMTNIKCSDQIHIISWNVKLSGVSTYIENSFLHWENNLWNAVSIHSAFLRLVISR